MTGKKSTTDRKKSADTQGVCRNTMDHSNYCIYTHNGTEEKSITDRKNPFILSNCITNSI